MCVGGTPSTPSPAFTIRSKSEHCKHVGELHDGIGKNVRLGQAVAGSVCHANVVFGPGVMMARKHEYSSSNNRIRAAAGQMGALSRIVLLCPLYQILWKLKESLILCVNEFDSACE